VFVEAWRGSVSVLTVGRQLVNRVSHQCPVPQRPVRRSLGTSQFTAASSARSTLRALVASELESMRDAGTWKSERVIVSRQAAMIYVAGHRQPLLNFCANNYLGLAVCTKRCSQHIRLTELTRSISTHYA